MEEENKLETANILKIMKAAQFAALKHRNHRRKDDEASPYINHPITVALNIAEIGGVTDTEVLAAALLHDTLEDTNTTEAELMEVFGKNIAMYVKEVSDDKSLPKEERKRRQIEHAPDLSKGATLIKLSDKISNVEDILNSPPAAWSIDRRREYLKWAEDVLNQCPPVNEQLKQYLSTLIEKGKEQLSD